MFLILLKILRTSCLYFLAEREKRRVLGDDTMDNEDDGHFECYGCFELGRGPSRKAKRL